MNAQYSENASAQTWSVSTEPVEIEHRRLIHIADMAGEHQARENWGIGFRFSNRIVQEKTQCMNITQLHNQLTTFQHCITQTVYWFQIYTGIFFITIRFEKLNRGDLAYSN